MTGRREEHVPTPRLNVMVASECPEVRALLSSALGHHFSNVTVHTAATVSEGKRLLGRHGKDARIHVVLTDAHLPGGHGYELVEHAKRSNPDVSVIGLSGDPDQAREAFLARGAEDLLPKPFAIARLEPLLLHHGFRKHGIPAQRPDVG